MNKNIWALPKFIISHNEFHYEWAKIEDFNEGFIKVIDEDFSVYIDEKPIKIKKIVFKVNIEVNKSPNELLLLEIDSELNEYQTKVLNKLLDSYIHKVKAVPVTEFMIKEFYFYKFEKEHSYLSMENAKMSISDNKMAFKSNKAFISFKSEKTELSQRYFSRFDLSPETELVFNIEETPSFYKIDLNSTKFNPLKIKNLLDVHAEEEYENHINIFDQEYSEQLIKNIEMINNPKLLTTDSKIIIEFEKDNRRIRTYN